jgi:hypothetical protein
MQVLKMEPFHDTPGDGAAMRSLGKVSHWRLSLHVLSQAGWMHAQFNAAAAQRDVTCVHAFKGSVTESCDNHPP